MPCQKAPEIRNKIVQSLSQKFSLRISLNGKKPGRPVNDLSEDEVEWLCQFTDRPNVTYTKPEKKDQRYIGKENGKSKFIPIHYLPWTITDLLEMFRHCAK